jgi:hypothetical protein
MFSRVISNSPPPFQVNSSSGHSVKTSVLTSLLALAAFDRAVRRHLLTAAHILTSFSFPGQRLPVSQCNFQEPFTSKSSDFHGESKWSALCALQSTLIIIVSCVVSFTDMLSSPPLNPSTFFWDSAPWSGTVFLFFYPTFGLLESSSCSFLAISFLFLACRQHHNLLAGLLTPRSWQ